MSEKARAERALLELLNLLERGRQRHRGLLGIPGQTTPEVSGRPNYVWFQEDGNPSRARQILNFKVPSISELPVIVGEDSNNPGIEQVLDVDIGMLPKWLDRPLVPAHHQTHELGAVDAVGSRVDSDVVFVQKAQFVPLSARAQDTPDMTLYVEADWYLYGSIQKYWAGGSTKSFSPPVTDGYAAYELVCIDGVTNQLVYVRGIDFPQAAPEDETLIPVAPLGTLPIVVVRLPHGETELTYENMADCRIFQSTMGGSITGFPHRHTSEFDGGYLSSGLTITGDVILKRASDDATKGYWYSELGEWHLDGGLSVTGDVVVTGGNILAYDTYSDLGLGDSRLRIARGTVVTGWSGQEAEVAWDEGFELPYIHDGEQWNEILSANSREVYPNRDEYGLFDRVADFQQDPDEHFNDDFGDLSAWAGAPFVTPTTSSFGVASIAQIHDSTAVGARAFRYETISAASGTTARCRARLQAGAFVEFAGMRLDDGTDDNYAEFGLRTTGLANGLVEFVSRYRLGGGAVTTATYLSGIACNFQFFVVDLERNTSDNIVFRANINGVQVAYIAQVAGGLFSFTLTRQGVTFETGLTTSATYAGFFDWYKSS